MCYEYDGSPECYSEGEHKAAKDHRCNECRRTIQKGTRYFRAQGLFDGAFFTHKMCLRCFGLHEAVGVVERSHGCGWHESRPPFGELWESIRDYGAKGIREIGLEFAKAKGA